MNLNQDKEYMDEIAVYYASLDDTSLVMEHKHLHLEVIHHGRNMSARVMWLKEAHMTAIAIELGKRIRSRGEG